MGGLSHQICTRLAGGALSLALATPVPAETAFDTAPEALPCLTASTDIADFRAAFAAAGWVEPATPADRTPALHALGEVRYVILRLPKLISQETWDRFIQQSHATAEKDRDFMLVMTRDGLSAGINIFNVGGTTHGVDCTLAGADIPGVAQAMTRPEAKPPNPEKPSFAALGLYSEQPEIPGYADLRYDWLLIEPPFPAIPPTLAPHSILVAYKFDAANPPVPPAAPQP